MNHVGGQVDHVNFGGGQVNRVNYGGGQVNRVNYVGGHKLNCRGRTCLLFVLRYHN